MPSILANSLLFLILMGISIKDFKDGIIPDVLLGGLAILGLLQWGGTHVMSVLILGLLAYSLYKLYPLLRNQEGLGFGDVKLMMVSGLWLEPSNIPFFLILAGGFGIGIGLVWRFLKKGMIFPLGPALALALGICIVGDQSLSKGTTEMTSIFSGPSLPPASGNKPDSIVVFLHGYGANGHDLLSLGNMWAKLLPNTLFVAPHGPAISELYPSGNQWFDLSDWNPEAPFTESQTERIVAEIQNLTPSFNQYLDDLLKTHNLPAEKLALVGFSQGTMFALHVALHRPLCAGVVGYSGAFLDDPKEAKIARPPILLVHGEDDQLVPARFSQSAEDRLKLLQVPVTLALIPDLEHGIDEKGLTIGGIFLRDNLYKNTQSDLWDRAKEGNN
jgi:phospholipase/carboxylesterase